MASGKDRTRDPKSFPDEQQEALTGGHPPDLPAPKGVGTAAGAVAAPEVDRGAPKLREIRLKNEGSKLVWLPLNSGEQKAIAAGTECRVLERDLQGNAAFEKLKQRRWITELDAARPEPR